jgi:cyclopropane fatty-acyl-phospholipid synthase-like methyltransferase
MSYLDQWFILHQSTTIRVNFNFNFSAIRVSDLPPDFPVFPGGHLLTLPMLLNSISSGSRGSFVIDSVTNHGQHYARTLREWRKRFEARWEPDIEPSLKRTYPDVMKDKEARDIFRRKWTFYLCVAFICHAFAANWLRRDSLESRSACEAGFAERALTGVYFLFLPIILYSP